MRPASNKEWIYAILNHKEGYDVPFHFTFTPLALEKITQYYGENFVEKLGFPIRMNSTKSIKPLYASPSLFGDSAIDEFGVVWSVNPIDRGTPFFHPLEHLPLKDYEIASAKFNYRFEGLNEWCEKEKDNFRIIWVGDLWERAVFMRGMENILLDVAINKPFVRGLLRKLADRILETMSILFEKFDFEGIAVSDDYGAQQSLLISPTDWRELIKPFLSEIYSTAKVKGKTVFHHSCGHVIPIIRDMIEIGLDILHPIQPETMDIFYLKKEFGKDITFCGGVPTQTLLIRGTADEIKNHVKHLKNEMGRNGGYILEPGITLQADVPLQNMVAMIEEAIKGNVY